MVSKLICQIGNFLILISSFSLHKSVVGIVENVLFFYCICLQFPTPLAKIVEGFKRTQDNNWMDLADIEGNYSFTYLHHILLKEGAKLARKP